MNVIELSNISKSYGGETATLALKDVSLEIKKGDFVAIMGPSGCGKSTLLHILGLLDRPSGGEYLLDGHSTADLSDRKLAALRSKKIGFVFQSFNLLPRLSLLANVELPMIYAGVGVKQRRERARSLLGGMGLKDIVGKRPNQVSGGQIQRTAIARALANHPAMILADEPTGNLDSHSGQQVMDILSKLNHKGSTIILVTHDSHVAGFARRVIRMKDGEVVS